MQTAYIIHMSEGPSIRRIVSTTPIDDPDESKLKLAISVQDCDEYFRPTGRPVNLTSKAARTSWRKRILKNEPVDGEANYHFNMRHQLGISYTWRYELNATLSDPLR
jgi:hypothetical protein